jgi:hypothetical protein
VRCLLPSFLITAHALVFKFMNALCVNVTPRFPSSPIRHTRMAVTQSFTKSMGDLFGTTKKKPAAVGATECKLCKNRFGFGRSRRSCYRCGVLACNKCAPQVRGEGPLDPSVGPIRWIFPSKLG